MMWIAVLGAAVAATVSVVATVRAYAWVGRPAPGAAPADLERRPRAGEDRGGEEADASELAWIVSILAQSELCRKLDPAALERVAASTSVRWVDQGEMIFAQDTVGDSMFVVGEGEVKLVLRSDYGEEIEIDRRLPMSFFGEFAMLDGQPRTASAVAVQPTRLIVLTRESLHQLFREPQVVDVLLRGLVDMIREADRQTAGQPPPDLQGVVARDLVRQARVEREVLRRSEIAERVGETSQSVRRVLESFEERDLVVIGDDVIVIRNLEGLRQQAASRHG